VELESVAPLSVFGSLQMLLPLGEHGEPEALDGKVIALSERDGAPTALVCFTGNRLGHARAARGAGPRRARAPGGNSRERLLRVIEEVVARDV
jgi:hypothetical protein